MNNYSAQSKMAGALGTLMWTVVIVAMMFIPAVYYGHLQVMPEIHHFLNQIGVSVHPHQGVQEGAR